MLLYICATLPACFLYKSNINFKSIWFDEADQYWIAQGRGAFTAPLADSGGLHSIYFFNKTANLDPGGYGYLLRVWNILFGSSLESLKTFSFVFYVLSILFIVKLVLSFVQSRIFQVICLPAIMSIFYSLTPRQYALEIRPYSMALCASVGMMLAIFLYFNGPRRSRRIFLILTIMLGIWSRYNTYVFVFATFVTLLIYLVKKNISLEEILKIVFFPILSLFFIYLTTTTFQNGGKPPAYVDELLLANATHQQVLKILSTNFFRGFGLLISFGLIFITLKSVFNFKERRDSSFSEDKTLSLEIWFVAALLLSALFSILGFLPWSLNSRWSNDQYALVALGCILPLRKLNNGFLDVLGVVGVMIYLGTNSAVPSFHDRWLSTDGANPVGQNLDIFSRGGQVGIDNFNYPETLYLLEKSGEYNQGSQLLKNLTLKAYDFAVMSTEKSQFKFPHQMQYLIVSLHWDSRVDRAIQDYLKNSGFKILRNEPRRVGGLGYAVYERI